MSVVGDVGGLLLLGQFDGGGPETPLGRIGIIKTERPLLSTVYFLDYCSDYFLLFIRDEVGYGWDLFRTEDGIPENAPEMGVFTSGEPIYLVRYMISTVPVYYSYTYYVEGDSVAYFQSKTGSRIDTGAMETFVLI